MNNPYFDDLLLVGGTSLALQIGHRESVDVDLFGKIHFEYNEISESLAELGDVTILQQSKNINIFTIDNVKVDFVNYRYPWINNSRIEHNIRLASLEDIAAMKLNAIAGRGTKKDFIDLYFLLQKFSMEEMFGFYSKKFDDGNIFLVQKSLTYFDDAEKNNMPKMHVDVDWSEIKETILASIYF